MTHNDTYITLAKRYNDTLKRIVEDLNYLENEFYVDIELNVGTMQITPSINDASSGTKLIEFNGDEWIVSSRMDE